MLDQAYQKTEAGRAEIKARALPLSRSARNLLLVIDVSKSGRQWLGLVQGVSEADLAFLLEQGLVAPAGAAAAMRVATAALAPAASPFGESPLMGYEQLYDYLNHHGARHLGPMKRYLFTLEVEQCQGLAQLQALALSLVERVSQAKGEDAARELRQAMGIKT